MSTMCLLIRKIHNQIVPYMKKIVHRVLTAGCSLLLCACGDETLPAPEDAKPGDVYRVDTDPDTGEKVLRPETTGEKIERKIVETIKEKVL